MAHEITGRYAVVDGTRAYYDVCGSGIPLVCIHMGWACSLQWQYFMPLMAAAGFEVVDDPPASALDAAFTAAMDACLVCRGCEGACHFCYEWWLVDPRNPRDFSSHRTRGGRAVADDIAGLARGIAFRSLTEQMDTTTPHGELLFSLFGALAQYERALTRERVMAGLAAAKRRGRQGGRPPMIDAETLERITAALDGGASKASVCRTVKGPRARIGWTAPAKV